MYNLFVEKLVIGGVLIEPSLADQAQKLLTSDFYGEEHQTIFSAITSLWEEDKTIDIATVQDRCKIEINNILKYLDITPSTLQFDAWVQIVKDYSRRRNALKQVKNIAHKIESTEDPVNDILEDLEYEEESEDTYQETINDVASSIFKKKENVIKIGYPSIDKMLDLSPSEMIIIAARPSVGKTAFALNVMRRANCPFLLFSVEMSKRKCIERLIAQEAKVNGQAIARHELSSIEQAKVSQVIGRLYEMPFEIIDDEYHINGIVAKSIMWAKKNTGIIAIDYLQYVNGDNSRKREQEIADISRKGKRLAKRIGMPVIMLAQLNRDAEKRIDHRPLLSDLRESGAIEQDADVVAFLYRGEMYEETADNKGVAEFIIAKNRNGPIGMAQLAWMKEYGCFEELERSE